MKIDCHMHVQGKRSQWKTPWDNDKIIEAADKLGIDKLRCSIPLTTLDEAVGCGSVSSVGTSA